MLLKLRDDVKKLASPRKAEILSRFFKTKEGEYGHGDKFLGLTVPESRSIAIKYRDLFQEDVKKLLESDYHEERLIALLMLVHNFQKGTDEVRKQIYEYYLKNTNHVNNWDLVDLTADKIVGGYLLENNSVIASERSSRGNLNTKKIASSLASSAGPRNDNRDILYQLAKSKNLWEKRIAIIATYQFIKEKKEYADTFAISEILLNDKHDLIHKAVGWMLREVGKRCSQEVLEQFLNKHHRQMPRTMLRYAIERFEEKKRKAYLRGTV